MATKLHIYNKPSTISSPWHYLRTFITTSPAARQPNRWYPDEETRIARYKYQLDYFKLHYHNDPEFRARRIQTSRDHYNTHKQDDKLRLRQNLTDWIRREDWVRDSLPWKTYTPLWYARKVKHYCHGCDWMRINGLKLWWRKKGAEEQVMDVEESGDGLQVKNDNYLCHTCYVNKRSRFEVLPEGYEDVKTFKDLVARKKEFEELNAASADSSN